MVERKRIVIIGGVAGGASAAARARRLCEDAEIVLLERSEYISFANCGLPYHIGGAIPERESLLVQTPESMHKRFRIDVRIRHEAVRIDREAKEVLVKNLANGEESTIRYDELILSPGARPIRPSIPGLDSEKIFTLRNMADMDAIKKVVDNAGTSRALVIGGGYIGLEMTEAMRERDVDVTLVELAPQVMGMVDAEMASPLHGQLRLHGVELRLGISVTEVRELGDSLEVILSNGEVVSCDIGILAIGVRPEVELAREAGLTIGELGGIAVDTHMRTSDPHIYAVGDAVEVENFVGGFSSLIPLAGPANRQGRIAADNIFGRDSEYRKTQGTAICKVFDLAIGATGLNERALKKAGMRYEKIYVHPASHAGYYPGASPLTLKLIFDPVGGKIFGAQVVGSEGVDKRIDVIATAIRAGMSVMDLKDLELSYAPPFGSAKDPVNYAGLVASNVISGDMQFCHVDEVSNPAENQLLLDVREAEEVQMGTIPGAIHISVDELRERMNELPEDKELLVFCQVGLRGYLACRILQQHGFKCKNLVGGYKTYQMVKGVGQEVAKQEEVKDDTGAESSLKRSDQMMKDESVEVVREIDACALQCPGPIMKLKNEIEAIGAGQAVAITTKDPAFAADINAWCHSTGNSLYKLEPTNGSYRATVVKRETKTQTMTESQANVGGKKKTIVVFSQDFDRAMAAFVIANGAAAMGSEVTLFFTFWGINILRKASAGPVRKNLIEKMFGWMMPKGADKLTLSKMNMGGMGTWMMKGIMAKKQVPSLSALIGSAKMAGVKLVACSMSMDLMGIKPEELIDGVEQGGVAMYLDHAEGGNVNLFI